MTAASDLSAPEAHAPRLYAADLLYTGVGGGLTPGGVVVVNGVVAATGHPDELAANYPHAARVDVGGIIAPPPVNAHTHLDMSAYDFQPLPYFRWMPEVVVSQMDKRGVPGAIRGADELVRLRVGGVGDIVYDEAVMTLLLSRDDLRGVAYFEVLGTRPEQAAERFAALRERIGRWRPMQREGGLRLGVTPHTPYTVSSRLMSLVTDYAAGEGLPMQIHVAEHPSEPELFATGGGSLWEHRLKPFWPETFAEVIGRDPEPGLTPVRYLDELGVLRHQPTLIHMVNVTADDIARVARHGGPVVTCPRSNAHLECGVFPWPAYAAAGVEVAVGTDSVASGETLDVRDDVAFARTLYPGLDPRVLVRAAVKGGSRALGLPLPFIRRGEAWDEAYLWAAR